MSVSPETRKRTATVKGPKGESKFPIPDKKHARLALQMINRAKPALTPSQEKAVRAKAAKFGVHSEKDKKK